MKLIAGSSRIFTQSNTNTDDFGQNSADFQGLTDATLIVEKQQLPVHKAILAANSSTFGKMFRACPGEERCSVVRLDDSLLDVCTTLKYLYDGCTVHSASKLKSIEDAYCVTKFAHKYDMKALLKQCEAYLVKQAAIPGTLFSQPGATVRWTLLAEKCEMRRLLAHCELCMAKKTDDSFWTDPAEKAMQLSSDSLLRMVRAGCWKNSCGRHTDVAQIFRCQQPSKTVWDGL